MNFHIRDIFFIHWHVYLLVDFYLQSHFNESDFSIQVNFLKSNSFLGQVKEDTCYVSDNFLRDMNVAKYVKVYVLFLF